MDTPHTQIPPEDTPIEQEEGTTPPSTQEGNGGYVDQMEEYKRGWQRAQADYQNLQKQVSEQRKMWARMSEAQILEEFIPVYDNFKKAFFAKPIIDDPAFSQWSVGIGFIMQQFSDIFRKHDLKEMEVVGTVFDPTVHECVKEEPVDGMPAGTIIREVSTGFLLDGSVFVPAKVIVAADVSAVTE